MGTPGLEPSPPNWNRRLVSAAAFAPLCLFFLDLPAPEDLTVGEIVTLTIHATPIGSTVELMERSP